MRLLRFGTVTRSTLVRLVPSVVPGLLMLAIALAGAGHPVLSWDEIATADVASRTPAQIGHLIAHIDGVFAPYYYLEHFWTGLAGTTELALRLPSILAMSGAAALTGELGRRLYGPLTGLLAGVLLCLMPNASRYAAEARPYAFACFFALLALLLLHAAADRPHPARWIAYGVAVLFLGLSHVIALTTLAAHAVVLIRRGSRRTAVCWAAAAVPALVLLVPVLWLGVHERGAQLSWVPPLSPGGLWNFPGQVVGSVAGGWLLLGLAVLALVRPMPVRAMPVRAMPVRALPARAEIAALAVGPIVAVAAVSVLVAPYWVARYLLVVLAPLALLAAAALHDLVSPAPQPSAQVAPRLSAQVTPSPSTLLAEPDAQDVRPATLASGSRSWDGLGRSWDGLRRSWDGRWIRFARLAAVVALLICAVYPGQLAVRTATAKKGSDYRTAAAIILKNQRPGDGIAYTANSRTMRTGLSYYLRHDHNPPQDVLLSRTAAQDATLKAVEFPPTPSRLAGAQRLWLLVYGTHPDPLTGRKDLRSVFDGRFHRTHVWLLHRATLALFVRLTPSTAPRP